MTDPTLRSVPLDRDRQVAPQVFERLRAQIIGMTLAPGTVLARNDLMARFGISQTPIRDALLRLAAEGLVDIFPQHTTIVSPIDLPLAKQAHFLRRSVEIEVVRALALLPHRPFMPRLRAIIAQQRALLEAQDFENFADADRSFHQQLYQLADVPHLWDLVRSRSGHLDRLILLHLPTPGKGLSILDDHATILDAIAAGDPGCAQDAMRQHLSGTLSRLDDIRASFPDFLRG